MWLFQVNIRSKDNEETTSSALTVQGFCRNEYNKKDFSVKLLLSRFEKINFCLFFFLKKKNQNKLKQVPGSEVKVLP